MDQELERASKLKREDLLAESGRLAESLGGVYLEVGGCVSGSSQSQRDFEDAFQMLHPGSNKLPRRGNDIRDAMHITCAARYSAQFFVTRDKGILKRAPQIRERFGLDVADPEQTLLHVEQAIDLTMRAHHQIGSPKWIPSWRP